MSRGPGKWQRLILQNLEEYGDGWFYLRDLLSDDFKQSEYLALFRAARRMAELEKAEIWYGWRPRQQRNSPMRTVQPRPYKHRHIYHSARLIVSRRDVHPRRLRQHGVPFGEVGIVRRKR